MTDGSRHATKVNRAPVLTLWAARSAGAGRAARLACTRRGFLHGGDDAKPAANSGLVLSEGRRSEGMVASAVCFIDKPPRAGAALRYRSDRAALAGRQSCPWFLALDHPSMPPSTTGRPAGP